MVSKTVSKNRFSYIPSEQAVTRTLLANGKPQVVRMLLDMKENMKKAFRMFKRNARGGIYYLLNKQTGDVRSLETTDKDAAQRLLDAENQAREASSLNLQLGVLYLRNADKNLATRTWQQAMDELSSHGKEGGQKRCKREMASKAFDHIRNKKIVETTNEDSLAVLKRGGSATNNYLRRLHNHCSWQWLDSFRNCPSEAMAYPQHKEAAPFWTASCGLLPSEPWPQFKSTLERKHRCSKLGELSPKFVPAPLNKFRFWVGQAADPFRDLTGRYGWALC